MKVFGFGLYELLSYRYPPSPYRVGANSARAAETPASPSRMTASCALLFHGDAQAFGKRRLLLRDGEIARLRGDGFLPGKSHPQGEAGPRQLHPVFRRDEYPLLPGDPDVGGQHVVARHHSQVV